jgi:hypothetical protein
MDALYENEFSGNPEAGWRRQAERFPSPPGEAGGSALALAHNGNLSNGLMFPVDRQYNGRKLDREYVEQRARWEPLYEITQIKGDGETHPLLSPNDEFADYETWDAGNLDLSQTKTDKGVFEGYELTASGYAAVWAQENTREALWDAMSRKLRPRARDSDARWVVYDAMRFGVPIPEVCSI